MSKTTKKYINVELARKYNFPPMPEVQPEDVIFFSHWFDTTYDHASENLGHFLLIGYLDGDKVKYISTNPEAWEPIKSFIERMGDEFVRAKAANGMMSTFFNKSMLPNLKVEKGTLIYQDMYRFSQSSFSAYFIANIDETEEQNSEWTKDPLKLL